MLSGLTPAQVSHFLTVADIERSAMAKSRSQLHHGAKDKYGETRCCIPDTLVQLFCLPWSGLIGPRYVYERTRIGQCALFIEIGVVNEQRTNRAEEL
jgi:hypothetical protein